MLDIHTSQTQQGILAGGIEAEHQVIVGLGLVVASHLIEHIGTLEDCAIFLRSHLEYLVKIGESLGIFLLTLIDARSHLIGRIEGFGIVGVKVFESGVDIVERLDIVVVSIIEIGPAHESLGIAGVFLEKLLVCFGKGLRHGVAVSHLSLG